MKSGTVLHTLGWLLLFLSVALLLPIPFSFYYQDGQIPSFLWSALIAAFSGLLLRGLFVPEGDLGFRDGFAIVTLGWLGAAFFGALPFYFSGKFSGFLDCFFESISGFTTTGSSILNQVEILAPSTHFWRALTQWLGGMGIIVLSLAILPVLGIGGMQLFQAEVPGPTKDRLSPRIRDTARILWGVYLLLTFFETGLLMTGGLSFFEALCHSFTTMATGGFSLYTRSIGKFESPWVEGVVTFFMVAAGANFTLHFYALRGRISSYWKSEEFRFYISIILLATFLLTFFNLAEKVFERFGESLRYSIFQVCSLLTTTGYATADFDRWPPLAKLLLVFLMFFGGCAGSTGGGIKHVRFLLLWRHLRVQVFQLLHPKAVKAVKLDGRKVAPEVMQAVLGFFFLYLGVFILASLLVCAQGLDMVTGVTAVAATLNNIGPGLGGVGPMAHFGDLPDFSKLVLTICMLTGRLELFTLVVLLFPAFWKETRKPVWFWQRRKKNR
ncbi:MAG: potassium transporter [Deltaproteobacteria bacterium RBG_13_43_22]|nr:MAG: potassium transporter [Deltaproteobacteria bacterium RBG_13_43_22]